MAIQNKSYQHRGEKQFRGYIKKIIDNAVADECRTRSREQNNAESYKSLLIVNSQLTNPNALIDSITIKDLMSRLPPTDKEILTLRFIMDLTHSQIADKLDISPAAARKRCSRAVKNIKGLLLQE